MEEKNINEAIKKTVDDESQKNNWLEMLGVSAGNIIKWLEETDRDERYLTDLANKTASNKSRHFIVVRSIVLDTQIRCDNCISFLIGVLSVTGGRDYGLQFNSNEENAVVEKFDDIDYARKMEVVSKLKVFSERSIEILWAVNNLRRAFAHGKREEHPEYKYCGESIFNRGTVEKLVKDRIVVIEEFIDFIKKKPLIGVKPK